MSLDVKWGGLLLAGCMLVPILWLGGVTHGGLLAAVVAVAAVSPIIGASRSASLQWSEARVAIAALGGAAGWATFQLVPLPPWLLKILSPHASHIWLGCDAILGREGSWHPISVDLSETAFMATTSTVVAAFFFVALRHASAPGGARTLLIGVTAVVLCFESIALAHALVGATRIYGIFAPVTPGPISRTPIVTPLMNANHAAALGCVATPILLGFGFESKSSSSRAIAFVGAAVSGAVPVMSFSRGGFVVLGLETLAMVFYRVVRPGTVRSRAMGALVGAGALAVAASGALYVAHEPIVHEASDTSVEKLRLFSSAARMIPDFFTTGVGRGAFASAFSAYGAPFGAQYRFTHVESWPVQLAVESGLPIAIAFVSAIGWIIVRCVGVTAQKPSLFGATVALCGLGIHDLADFSMEFAGVALIAAALLAVVVSARGTRPRQLSARMSLRSAILAGLTPIVAFVALLLPHWHHALLSDCEKVAAEWTAGRLEAAGPTIIAAEARHPAEPYFPMAAGVRVLATPDAAPLLLRAVELGPGRAQTHFWFARWFLMAGRRGQAWAEYREALRIAPTFRNAVVDDMMAANAPLDDIEAAASTEEDLETASARLTAQGRLDDGKRLDDDLLQLYPPAVPARLRILGRLLAAQDLPGARAAAEELISLASNDPRAYLALASVGAGPIEQEAAIERGLAACGDAPSLLEALVRTRGIRLGLGAVRDPLERLRKIYAEQGAPDRYFAIQADVELASNHPAAAVGLWLEASSAALDGDAYLRTAAAVAEQHGQLEMAESLYKRLAAKHPDDPEINAALLRLKPALSSPLDPPSP
jgi:hypothetical protein